MAIHTQVSDSYDHRDRDWTDAAASQRIVAATKTPKHTQRKKGKNVFSPRSHPGTQPYQHLESGVVLENVHF